MTLKTAFYNRYDYRRFWDNRGYEHYSDQLALRRLLSYLPQPRQRTLDAGGGYGRNLPVLLKTTSKLVLLDPARKNLNIAQKQFSHWKNLTYTVGYLEHLPFPNNYFDTVVCIRVSHHLSDLLTPTQELARVCQPGGYLILEIANKVNIKSKIKALFNRKYRSILTLTAVDRRSAINRTASTITFVNHHPQAVEDILTRSGFIILKTLSVSNWRNPIANLPVLFRVFRWLEYLSQSWLAHFYFGPSIYYLAKRT